MKLVIHDLRPAHGNAFRQIRIDAAHPGRQRAVDRGLEMHDLMARMHPGVGAPGTHHAD
jgi:hypothetical protein